MDRVHRLDFSHTINHLSFGDYAQVQLAQQIFGEGELAPLDTHSKMRTTNAKEGINYEYFIKVVPTTYRQLDTTEYYINQFSVSTNEYNTNSAPVIYFRYDLSPVTVLYSQQEKSFFHFLVQLCAIVGGVFAVAGLLDEVLHNSISSLLKKHEARKLG